MYARRRNTTSSAPIVAPTTQSAVTSTYGSVLTPPRITRAGNVKIAPAATASPADAIVCTTLFSRIVEPPRIRSIAIEMTAAGMLVEMVSPHTNRDRHSPPEGSV